MCVFTVEWIDMDMDDLKSLIKSVKSVKRQGEKVIWDHERQSAENLLARFGICVIDGVHHGAGDDDNVALERMTTSWHIDHHRGVTNACVFEQDIESLRLEYGVLLNLLVLEREQRQYDVEAATAEFDEEVERLEVSERKLLASLRLQYFIRSEAEEALEQHSRAYREMMTMVSSPVKGGLVHALMWRCAPDDRIGNPNPKTVKWSYLILMHRENNVSRAMFFNLIGLQLAERKQLVLDALDDNTPLSLLPPAAAAQPPQPPQPPPPVVAPRFLPGPPVKRVPPPPALAAPAPAATGRQVVLDADVEEEESKEEKKKNPTGPKKKKKTHQAHKTKSAEKTTKKKNTAAAAAPADDNDVSLAAEALVAMQPPVPSPSPSPAGRALINQVVAEVAAQRERAAAEAAKRALKAAEAEAKRVHEAAEAKRALHEAAEAEAKRALHEAAEAKRVHEAAEAKRVHEAAEAKRALHEAAEAEAKRALHEAAEAKRVHEAAEAKRIHEAAEAKRALEAAAAAAEAKRLGRQDSSALSLSSQRGEEATQLADESSPDDASSSATPAAAPASSSNHNKRQRRGRQQQQPSASASAADDKEEEEYEVPSSQPPPAPSSSRRRSRSRSASASASQSSTSDPFAAEKAVARALAALQNANEPGLKAHLYAAPKPGEKRKRPVSVSYKSS
jgi:hypothetical protein